MQVFFRVVFFMVILVPIPLSASISTLQSNFEVIASLDEEVEKLNATRIQRNRLEAEIAELARQCAITKAECASYEHKRTQLRQEISEAMWTVTKDRRITTIRVIIERSSIDCAAKGITKHLDILASKLEKFVVASFDKPGVDFSSFKLIKIVIKITDVKYRAKMAFMPEIVFSGSIHINKLHTWGIGDLAKLHIEENETKFSDLKDYEKDNTLFESGGSRSNDKESFRKVLLYVRKKIERYRDQVKGVIDEILPESISPP